MSITRNEIKEINSLQNKKGRNIHKLYIAEGVRLLEEAIFHNITPDTVYYSPDLLNPRGQSLIEKMLKKKIRTIDITNAEIAKISNTETSQGIIALFKIKYFDQTEQFFSNNRRILWCENISDPGNMGTLIRTAIAFGFNNIIYSGSTADPFSPKVVRSSVGSVFGIKLLNNSNKEILTMLKEHGYKIAAADINGENIEKLLEKNKNFSKLVLAIGSEAHGLSNEILDEADYKIKIEHSENVESLNAAVAGSIIMNRLAEF